MKKYNFDEEIDRKGTQSVKWDKNISTSAKEVFPLWVADMDFVCSDAIIDALHEQANHRIFGYNTGFDTNYRNCVCSWFKKRFDWEIDPSTIFYAGGVVPALSYLIEILSEKGDGVVIQTPVYYPFAKKIKARERRVVENQLLNTNGNYTMDFQDLEQKLAREDVKGMILCSPHNPVGRVWKQEELERVIEIAQRYHKWIISDEIHCDLVRNEFHHIPLLKIGKAYQDHIITCCAPSKSFNLAGLANSNIIIPSKEIQQKWIAYVQECLSLSGPNSFALSATKAAYLEGEEWLDQVNTYIGKNIEFTREYLGEHLPECIVSPSEGTYLVWVDVRNYCKNKDCLEKTLLEHGIILDEGYLFGEAGSGFERINVACSKDLLARCLSVFVKAIKGIKENV
ncbi:MAG: MalY/PatB family protein [Longicatena sp.]